MKIKLLHTPTVLLLTLLASVFSLAFALISEYGFGLKPCELCIFQRIPFALVIGLAVIGLWRKGRGRVILLTIGLLFLINTGIAGYHAGVEQKWFPGPDACTSSVPDKPLTMEEILAKLKSAPLVACDQPQWDFYGITMAAMNAVWSLLLAIATFIALHKIRKQGVSHA